MSKPKQFVVFAEWDAEANVWVATSEDVPGLVTGAPTLEQLIVKLEDLVPELLEENGVPLPGGARDVPWQLHYQHPRRAASRSA